MSYTAEEINKDIEEFEGIAVNIKNMTTNTRFNKLYSAWAIFPLDGEAKMSDLTERVRRYISTHAIHSLRVVK